MELNAQQAKRAAGGMQGATVTPGQRCPKCGQMTMTEEEVITDAGDFITMTCPCGYREEHNTFFETTIGEKD